MNSQEDYRQKTGAGVYVLAILGAFLIVALLVWVMRSSSEPPPINAGRNQERLKNLADVQAAEEPLVSDYDWQDKPRKMIRVPIDRAMELFLQESPTAAASRSNFMARATKAFAPLPKVSFE